MRIDTSFPSSSSDDRGAPAHVVLRLLTQALSQIANDDRLDRAACARYIEKALQIHLQASGAALPKRPAAGLAKWQILLVNEVALANLDAPLAIRELAAACRLSRGYFTRSFKVTFGDSPHNWRHKKRLEHACFRLTETVEPIAEIAIICGFNDQAHFTRAFKNEVGVTPNAYRRGAVVTSLEARESVEA